jgi:hypothetical protein
MPRQYPLDPLEFARLLNTNRRQRLALQAVWTNLIQLRMQASGTKAAKLSISLSQRVAMRREFFARLKKRSMRLRKP